MQLSKIQAYIEAFKQLLTTVRYQEEYKWEALQNFQGNWDITAIDFGAMYDQSFQSQVSRKLWNAPDYEPKRMMLKFIEMEPEFVRSMFIDLLDESRSIDARMSRFVFYCDDLLQNYRKRNEQTRVNAHYHDDYQMVSLYLAFHFPEKYCLYHQGAFQQMLQQLNARNVPLAHDLERFFKVVKTLNNFLQKDTDLIEAHQAIVQAEKFYQEENLLLAHDFYWCCTQPEFKVKLDA
ncbi:MAG: hypothetical protein AB8G15_23435 [Saprospiraceae bacterium]